jgi:hypothetical protein
MFVPPGSNLKLTGAEEINDLGEIFGMGTLPDGTFRAFVLMPCGATDEGCVDVDMAAVNAATSVIRTPSTRIPPDKLRQMFHRRQLGPWLRH